jgi:glycosyltransferase involved in cell wall biosynthesis
LPLLPIFEQLKDQFQVRFVAVGAQEADFCNSSLEIWSWSEETEVSSIQQFDIGIMPLTDSPWERGKCGYKLIQYMACGIPVIASPIGVNQEIVLPGKNGFLAKTEKDWKQYLEKLITMSWEERLKMGNAGRKLAVEHYSTNAQAPRLLALIQKAAQ